MQSRIDSILTWASVDGVGSSAAKQHTGSQSTQNSTQRRKYLFTVHICTVPRDVSTAEGHGASWLMSDDCAPAERAAEVPQRTQDVVMYDLVC